MRLKDKLEYFSKNRFNIYIGNPSYQDLEIFGGEPVWIVADTKSTFNAIVNSISEVDCKFYMNRAKFREYFVNAINRKTAKFDLGGFKFLIVKD